MSRRCIIIPKSSASTSAKADRPNTIVLNGVAAEDTAEPFADKFRSIYTNEIGDFFHDSHSAGLDKILHAISINEEVIEECIKKMKQK